MRTFKRPDVTALSYIKVLKKIINLMGKAGSHKLNRQSVNYGLFVMVLNFRGLKVDTEAGLSGFFVF